MIAELLRAFMIIMVAEMGDKTQLLAMTFATKYSTRKVLLGVGIGSFLNHGLAIIFGTILARYIDLANLQIIGGIMFLIFGIWGLRADDDEEEAEAKERFGPVLTVALAFFIGELGDKTQLAAMTISTYSAFPFFILGGTVLGMIFTSSLGIYVGVKIGDKVPELYIKIVSSVIFLIFGLSKLYSSLPERLVNWANFSLLVLLVSALAVYMIRNLLSDREVEYSYKEVADMLRQQDVQLRLAVENLCLGKETCEICSGSECAIGFIKEVLETPDIKDHRIEFHKKKFSEAELIEALSMTIHYLFKNREKNVENRKLALTKTALEKALFGQVIEDDGNIYDYIENIKHENRAVGIKVENRLKSLASV